MKRVDGNQSKMVAELRNFCTVAHIHEVGNGVPDIIVGCRGLTLVGGFDINRVCKALADIPDLKIYVNANLLYEIKDGEKPPSKRRLTEKEEKFHLNWKGPLFIVKDNDEALELAGAINGNRNTPQNIRSVAERDEGSPDEQVQDGGLS